jgi:NAD(P)-dependent dehydrogenase (short-subunit alcohol dehydrogenase family)
MRFLWTDITGTEWSIFPKEETYPSGRLGTLMDVACASAYLGSDKSSWVRGIALPLEAS